MGAVVVLVVAAVGAAAYLLTNEKPRGPVAKRAPASQSASSPSEGPAFIGLQVQGVTEAIAKALDMDRTRGVVVRDAALGGAASAAGVRRGDIIVHFAGTDIDTFDALVSRAGQLSAGDTIDITVLRAGEEMKLSMQADAKPAAWQIETGAIAVLPAAGLTLAALNERMRERFRVRWGATGVVISAIDMSKPAASSLREGDIIVQVNQQDIWNPEQVSAALELAKQKQRNALLLLIEAAEGFRLVLFPVP